MKLSIIVPVHNMAKEGKLQYCLNSLLAQTIDDYEIIAVDDSSTDSSLEILFAYRDVYRGKIVVITEGMSKRQGGARNMGVESARGEWISFVDSDDWVAPDFCEKLLKKAEETGADVVGCDYSLVYEHTMEVGEIVHTNTREQTGILDKEKHKSLILRSGSMVIKIYKAQLLRDNNLYFPEGMFYEDNCAGPVWSMYFKHFERVEEPLYYYYQHSDSTVHHITAEKCRDRLRSGMLLLEESRKRGLYEEYRQEIDYRFTELYFVNTLFSYMQGMEKKRLSYVKRLLAQTLVLMPNFWENSYYEKYTPAEEKRLIEMLRRSPWKFFWYYRMLNCYRKFRKKFR